MSNEDEALFFFSFFDKVKRKKHDDDLMGFPFLFLFLNFSLYSDF